ncbi:Bug family tripartite tricarboxylate transporter substrate binding protein [Verticiella sediminum]|nr:tripartite tricarboxylate transporter substrate binding protein [Verticiella sediminum]
MNRRNALLACTLSLAGLLAPLSAAQAASSYPDKPVRILVPFPAGGAADVFARILGEKLGSEMNQPFLVENRPGGGGIIATESAFRSAADGHTLLLVTVGHAVNPSLYSNLNYDTLKDFTPVSMIATLPSVLSVNPQVGVNSLAELIEQAKAAPGKMTYASAGNASTSHMAMAQLNTMAGIALSHVPYRGAPPALTDVVGGHVQMIIDPVVTSKPMIEKGSLRALAVTSAERTPLLPDVPTMQEAGVPGYDFSAWFMLLAPAGTPPAVIDALHEKIQEIQQTEDVKARYTALGAQPGQGTPADAAEFLRREVERYALVVRENNITVE